MLSPEVLRALDAAWSPAHRGMIRAGPPSEVTPALDPVLRHVAASDDPRWPFVLLSLARESGGALRERLLDETAGMLDRAPARRWVRIDELARPAWGLHLPSDLAVAGRVRAGLRGWHDGPTLGAIRAGLGPHVTVPLLASMHPNGRIRQAAVVELAGDVRGLPALLLRVNDWVAPVRDDALRSLHALVDPAHVEAWLRAMPLLLRLGACGRDSHGPLIDRVGTLFREAASRDRLLGAVRTLDAPSARAAAQMALRVFGAGDREVLQAFLRCPDLPVRLLAVEPSSPGLDGDLLDVALGDPVPAVRRKALDGLRGRDPRRFAERLRTACFDRSGAVREYAVFHLREAGALDAAALADEARRRIAAGRDDLLGAVGFLCGFDGDAAAAEIAALAEHPRGSIRLCAKRRLIREHRYGDAPDVRLLDDPSPKIARRLIRLLRERGVEPDVARIARRVEDGPTDLEACAWLNTLAGSGVWAALPHLVRTMGDRRVAVAARARRHVDAILRGTFRAYVVPDARLLDQLAAALRDCRDARAGAVTAWVRAMTGRREWPSGA